METNNYLKTFFQEKKVPYKLFEIKDKNNNVHLIDTEVVIHNIIVSSETEQKQIASILRKIDFKNGSVLHFLKYLAHGLVQQHTIPA